MKDLSQIRLVFIKEAALGPREFLEQAPDMPWSAKDFYENYNFYAESPFSFLYAIIDRADMDDPQKGVLWLTIDPMSKTLIGNFVSIKKEYQAAGLYRKIVVPYVLEMKKQLKLRHLCWITTRAKAYEKMGGAEFVRGKLVKPGIYRRSKLVLMEIAEEENEQE